jgi:hypothetical protein
VVFNYNILEKGIADISISDGSINLYLETIVMIVNWGG